jgi:integrase
MGQHAQGWSLRLPPGKNRSVLVVRFRHNGRRITKSTGHSDRELASREAARVYAEVVSGRKVARTVSKDLASAVSDFLAAFAKTNSAEWAGTVGLYWRAHLLPFFSTLENFTPASYEDYIGERLQCVSRSSVKHELSALRVFREWAGKRGLELPPVPSLARSGDVGTRHKQARKRKATILSPAQVRRLLMAMPVKSKQERWCRPLFTLLWETGLRPTTLLQLETPLHYAHGNPSLFVTREIDKEAFERSLPLTPAARKALDQVCPEDPNSVPQKLFPGFKKGTLRKMLELAVDKAGLGALDVSPYDFRHSRITGLANSPDVPLTGVSYLAGHSRVSTTALYIQGSRAAAERALAAFGERSGERRPKQAPSGGSKSGRKSDSKAT